MQDRLDDILNQGIATYAAPEPLAGLEERILRRVNAAKAPAKRQLILWLATAPVALLVFFLLPHQHQEPAHPVLPVIAASTSTPAKLTASAAVAAHGFRNHRPKAFINSTFSIRTPLTPQERSLAAMVTQSPETAAAIVEFREKQREPLQIEDLVIQPLETGN